MDLNNLSDKNIKEIIDRLKYPQNTLSYYRIDNIISTMFGKIDTEEAIVDDDDLEYVLRLYRGKYNSERFSIHIRLKKTHDHIVRVDMNPNGKHENPDGTIITGSHIHIYSNNFIKRDAVAIPLCDYDFPNVKTIIEAYSEFIKMVHIKKTKGVN